MRNMTRLAIPVCVAALALCGPAQAQGPASVAPATEFIDFLTTGFQVNPHQADTLAPGVVVQCLVGTGIVVEGALVAVGTPETPVRKTTSRAPRKPTGTRTHSR